MRNRYLLGVGVALAVALSWADARAQLAMPSGPGTFYFGGGGGWTDLESQNINTAVGKAKQSFKDGFNVGIRGGYEWGPLRFEEEVSFRDNNLSSINGFTALDGRRSAWAFMTNAIYDFTLGWPITPHIGVGVGAVDQHDSVGTKVPVKIGAITVPAMALSSSSDLEFGYQAIAGVRYNINPALAFDLDYRYLATTSPTFKAFNGSKYTSGYSTHNIVASLSVRFGVTPPVVPPPIVQPPPIPTARKFTVYFGWDKDTLTRDGAAIVQQAAEAWRSGAPVTIQVIGYTDTSGSAGYNLRLSQRRANTVANALARAGVPRSSMDVQGRGENDLAVPTPKGVRDPLNRRVEILFP